MDTPIADALRRLDTLDHDVTAYEAEFLDSVLRRHALSPKQKAVLARMCEQYLPDGDALSAEIRGQQRLC